MSSSDAIKSRAIGLLSTYRIATNSGSFASSSPPSLVPVSDPVGHDWHGEINMHHLVDWLDSRVNAGLGLSAAKCYRRWLASYFESIGHPGAMTIRCWFPEGFPVPIEGISAGADSGVSLVSERSSAGADTVGVAAGAYRQRADHIARADFTLLFEQLTGKTAAGTDRYVDGTSAALFFSVTIMTGLRPMEWLSARYMESHYDPETNMTLPHVLEVQTLKQQGRREDNPLRDRRYLVLDCWVPEQLQQLKLVLGLVRKCEDFKSLYDRMRMTIQRAWKRVCRAHQHCKAMPAVNFYTARHTFAEEVRRSDEFSRYELAALLGHSMLTNQMYYGPKEKSCVREYPAYVLPRPWPGDADNIMRWDDTVNPVRRQRDGQDQQEAASFYLR